MRKRQRKKNARVKLLNARRLFYIDKACAIATLVLKQNEREFQHRLLNIHPIVDLQTRLLTQFQINAISAQTFNTATE